MNYLYGKWKHSKKALVYMGLMEPWDTVASLGAEPVDVPLSLAAGTDKVKVAMFTCAGTPVSHPKQKPTLWSQDHDEPVRDLSVKPTQERLIKLEDDPA